MPKISLLTSGARRFRSVSEISTQSTPRIVNKVEVRFEQSDASALTHFLLFYREYADKNELRKKDLPTVLFPERKVPQQRFSIEFERFMQAEPDESHFVKVRFDYLPSTHLFIHSYLDTIKREYALAENTSNEEFHLNREDPLFNHPRYMEKVQETWGLRLLIATFNELLSYFPSISELH